MDEGTLDTEVRDRLTAVMIGEKDQPWFYRSWEQRRNILTQEFQDYVNVAMASNLERSKGLYLDVKKSGEPQ